MKLKIIKDNEVVVDVKEYTKLLCFENMFKSMQRKILDGKLPRFTTWDGYYDLFKMMCNTNEPLPSVDE